MGPGLDLSPVCCCDSADDCRGLPFVMVELVVVRSARFERKELPLALLTRELDKGGLRVVAEWASDDVSDTASRLATGRMVGGMDFG